MLRNFSAANKVVAVFLGVILMTAFYLSTHRVPPPPLDTAIAFDPRDIQITVTGESKVQASTNHLRVRFGIQQTAWSALEAETQIQKQADKMRTALTNQGISEMMIRQINHTIQAQWEGSVNQGYLATTQFEINNWNPNSETDIIKTLLRAGANQIIDTQYMDMIDGESRKQAFKAAMDDARARAGVIAVTMGREIGDTVSVTEITSEQGKVTSPEVVKVSVVYRLKF
ncbi:SIMPL domain-containing protein [Heliophilum fasciatum]|uniref:SIMPL domain-containing protein n=1 Tax=Heliophilum fasciatum TaxID=35700 RepID=A0A4R2REV6_9FIRM|nr:SIMPL domain-containing protein [Heliophilum fasciatum]MCW2278929.1 uncharacterized protein YggE [Heliophilum fasciatum]TCP62062.1 hypothetical protein EDD73_12436 [Heliophilum fasciatum]